jgi:hypothetical protein
MNVFKKTVTLAAAVSLVCLSSAGAMAANKLIVKDTAGTNDKFVVTDTGLVGSGTNAPAGAFHAQGNTYPTTQVIAQWNGTLAQFGGGGFVGLYNNNGNALPLSKDRLGYFLFGTMNGASKLLGGGMNVNAEADWTASSAPTSITFLTAAAGSVALGERLRITGSGNIGIGTPTPLMKLEVNGGVRLNTAVARPLCGSNVRGTIWFERGAVSAADTLAVCAKDASENYAWRPLF